MVETIYDLFRQCTVCIKIPGAQGTGFFVYPGEILSCAHVLEQPSLKKITSLDQIIIDWQGQEIFPIDVTLIPEWKSSAYQDLVMLMVSIKDHPCVYLDTLIMPGDELYSYGYPDSLDKRRGDSLTIDYSGPNDADRMMTLKDENIRGGFSGAPLLHLQSFSVCGLIKSDRAVRVEYGNRPLGGRGIPIKQADAHFANLLKQNRAFHNQDRRWKNAVAALAKNKQTHQDNRKSSADIIQCLWSLDYDSQDDMFKAHTPRSRRAAAFVVQAKDSRIQSWLVKRLAKKIPNVAKATVFTITVPKHPMWKNRDFNELWLDLSKTLGCNAESQQVIQALVNVYRTKPIVIAMYGWSAAKRSQQLQQQVLDKLWTPLVNAVASLANQPLRSRLILFLAEGNGTVTDIAPRDSANHDPNPNDNAVVPIRLAPLVELTREHIAEWMERDDVYALLEQLLPEDQIASLINEEILEWNSDPVETLEQICYIFELDGIAALEEEWKRWAG